MAGLKYWVWLSEVKGLTNRSKLLLLDYLEKGLQPEAFLRTYRFADRKTIPYCGCR